jgi:hypothetical protein
MAATIKRCRTSKVGQSMAVKTHEHSCKIKQPLSIQNNVKQQFLAAQTELVAVMKKSYNSKQN